MVYLLSNQNKDILLSIAQTYAKLVSSQEILLNDNVNLKEKSEFNIKQINELKRKLQKENDNLDELKKNSAEIKIDIHNKRMKQNKPKIEQEPKFVIKQKNRNPSIDMKNHMTMSMASNRGERKVAFQTDDNNKMCECNCLIF